jgi:hypothetical protein
MYLFNKYWLVSELCPVAYFVHLDIILILVMGFYSGLSGRVRTVYLFSLCVVSLLSSRFTASALVWLSYFLKYLVFHFLFHWALCSFGDLHGSCGCLCTKVLSELIRESWIESAGGFRCWNWRLSRIAEFHRSVWVWIFAWKYNRFLSKFHKRDNLSPPYHPWQIPLVPQNLCDINGIKRLE